MYVCRGRCARPTEVPLGDIGPRNIRKCPDRRRGDVGIAPYRAYGTPRSYCRAGCPHPAAVYGRTPCVAETKGPLVQRARLSPAGRGVCPKDRQRGGRALSAKLNGGLTHNRTIPPSRLTPCHLPLHKGGFGGVAATGRCGHRPLQPLIETPHIVCRGRCPRPTEVPLGDIGPRNIRKCPDRRRGDVGIAPYNIPRTFPILSKRRRIP